MPKKRISARYLDNGENRMDAVLDMFGEAGKHLVRVGLQHHVQVFEGQDDTFCVMVSCTDGDGRELDQTEVVEADFAIAAVLGATAALERLGMVRSSALLGAVVAMMDRETEEMLARRGV